VEARGIVATGGRGGDGGGIEGIPIAFIVPTDPGSEAREVEEVTCGIARLDDHCGFPDAPGRAGRIGRGAL
jgi:hypothetical protein